MGRRVRWLSANRKGRFLFSLRFWLLIFAFFLFEFGKLDASSFLVEVDISLPIAFALLLGISPYRTTGVPMSSTKPFH